VSASEFEYATVARTVEGAAEARHLRPSKRPGGRVTMVIRVSPNSKQVRLAEWGAPESASFVALSGTLFSLARSVLGSV